MSGLHFWRHNFLGDTKMFFSYTEFLTSYDKDASSNFGRVWVNFLGEEVTIIIISKFQLPIKLITLNNLYPYK